MNGLLGLLALSAAFVVLGSVLKGILRPISWAALVATLLLGSRQIGSAAGLSNAFGESLNTAQIGLQNVADPLAAQIIDELRSQVVQTPVQPSSQPNSPQPVPTETVAAPETPTVSASPPVEPSPSTSPIGGLW